MIAVLCGGVGAARFLSGLQRIVEPESIVAIVNVGDDSVLHGLHISPDLDTITYTLAGAMNTETGWGLANESWRAMEMVHKYADANEIRSEDPAYGEAAGWFALGDQDLGTHLYRTSRLAAGVPLDQVTSEIARSWGLELHLIPATNDQLRTRLFTITGAELAFQEYFVRERHGVPIEKVEFAGAAQCKPAPGVLDAIRSAEAVVIAPSNPVVSIDPILAVPGIRDALRESSSRTVAISPIIGGAAVKGPAVELMAGTGIEPTSAGIAEQYSGLASTVVIDTADSELSSRVTETGIACVVTNTLMSTPEVSADLARTTLAAVGVHV